MNTLPPYPAALYSALHTGTDGDLAFYRAACSGADEVLELGCGNGRVLAALDCSHRVGLDLHEGLLDMARRRLAGSATLLLGDMRTFSLDDRFDRVLLPFSGVYCLLDDRDVRACFARVHAHLKSGGTFILDAYGADAFHPESDPEDVGDDDWSEVAVVEAETVAYSVYERSAWDPDRQRIDVVYRHVALDGQRTPVDGVIEQRYLLRHQLLGHLRDAGFADVELFGGFDGQPWAADADHWVALARR